MFVVSTNSSAVIIIKINYLNKKRKKDVYVEVYALKSANRILFLDMVGTFFVFKTIKAKSRSPPTINLDFKKI